MTNTGKLMNFLCAWERGEITNDDELIYWAQELLDSGLAFSCQWAFADICKQLLKKELIKPKPGVIVRDYFGKIIAIGDVPKDEPGVCNEPEEADCFF